jgi:hypothetical protein
VKQRAVGGKLGGGGDQTGAAPSRSHPSHGGGGLVELNYVGSSVK